MNTRTALRTRVAATAAVLASLSLTLSACGGSGAEGTYYTEDANGTSALGQLVIDGNTLTHHEYDCEGVYEEVDVTSTGEFNEDHTQITWTVAGDDERNERVGTESVTISDTSITIDEDVYVLEDSNAGEALMSGFKTECEDD